MSENDLLELTLATWDKSNNERSKTKTDLMWFDNSILNIRNYTNFYSKIPGSNSSRNSFRMPCYWIFCCFHLFKKKVSKNVQKSINTSEDDSWYYNNLWKAYRNINFNYSKIFFLKKKKTTKKLYDLYSF